MADHIAIDDIFSTLNVAPWSPPDQASAFEGAMLAVDAYDGHSRDQGTPYLAHPLAVVTILRQELHVTAPHTLVLGLLHDALEVSPEIETRIRTSLGDSFAAQLRAMTPDHRLEQRRKHASDEVAWRAKTAQLPPEELLVRLADRIHNLRDLQHSPNHQRRERFLTALTDFYLPLARASRATDAHLGAACTVLEKDFATYTQRKPEARI